MASRPDTGVSLVLAGAGTGKTKTLVEKVRNCLTDLPLKPENCLILTFSRKAAEEIRERIAAGIGDSALKIGSGTFHSYCLSLLKKYWNAFRIVSGYDRFPVVADESTSRELMLGLIRQDLDRFQGMPAGVVLNLVLRLENLEGDVRDRLVSAGIFNELTSISEEYAEMKLRLGYMDFQDMMTGAITMLSCCPEVREEVLSSLQYLFVDEFQDTSRKNFRLLSLILPEKNRNLFAVGDDWQSIYGFRQARVDYIVNAKKYFPEARIHRLRINYRSHREIVRLSTRFISRNRFRTRKKLISSKGRGGIVQFHTVADLNEEALLVRNIIDSEIDLSSSVAILYRNNWQKGIIKNLAGSVLANRDSLSFMTMHASKGLEFESVIITGVSDLIIPDRDSSLEEERRLFYVALTRARKRLHIIVHRNDQGKVSLFGIEAGMRKDRNIQ